MASFIKLVYLLIVLSIAADLFSLGGNLFNTGSENTAVQSPLLLPGAEAILGALLRAAAKAASKSAVKAAKKQAKRQAKKAGEARNKAKRKGGKGMWVFGKQRFKSIPGLVTESV